MLRTVSMMMATPVPARIARQAASPPMPGMLMSSSTSSGWYSRSFFERLFAGPGVVHFVSGAGERGAHDAANLGLVVHHQDAAGAHRRAPPLAVDRQGQPESGFAGTAVTVSSPWWACTMLFAMLKPRPEPGTWLLTDGLR